MYLSSKTHHIYINTVMKYKLHQHKCALYRVHTYAVPCICFALA